jgi:hypothetical protein
MSLKNNAPAFDFYPERWLAGVVELSDAEQIRYLRLLCHQWIREGLPADVATLKRLAGGPVSAVLLEKFPVCEDGRRRNRRLELVRQDQRDRLDAKRLGAAMTNAKRYGVDALSEDERALLARFGRLADGQLVNGRRHAAGVASDIASDTLSDTGSDIASSSPPPTPHPSTERESTAGAPAQAHAARDIAGLYPRQDAPAAVLEAILDDLASGEDPEAIRRQVAECAEHIRKAPGGSSNRYVPTARAFFTDRQWRSPEAFAARWSPAAEAAGNRQAKPIRPADVSDVKPSNLREL